MKSGKTLGKRGRQVIPADDRLVVEMPGGGGFGAPADRDPELVARDVADGFVSAEAARDCYKVVLDGAMGPDVDATRVLRSKA